MIGFKTPNRFKD